MINFFRGLLVVVCCLAGMAVADEKNILVTSGSDRGGPVATAGYQDVLFIRRRYPCHTANNDKHSSKKVSHKARSSGVNVILNER